MIRFSQLAHIAGGSTLLLSKDRDVTRLMIDSRKVAIGEDSLFFAIRGQHHNGHDYIHSLYHQGVRQFVGEQPIDTAGLDEANILLAGSSTDALQALAAHHRQGFSIPIAGITGSNGKTIVKEWLYQLLSKTFNIVKNPGSYNSQLGVPLSVWQLQEPHHELGIFELGISQTGEMQKLAAIIKPTLASLPT